MDWTALSDSELDAAWSAYYDAGQANIATQYGLTAEIVSRQAGLFSAIGGVFGQVRFPMYEARTSGLTGFGQASTAQQAVADSAVATGGAIGNAAKAASNQIVLVLIAAAALIYMVKK